MELLRFDLPRELDEGFFFLSESFPDPPPALRSQGRLSLEIELIHQPDAGLIKNRRIVLVTVDNLPL